MYVSPLIISLIRYSYFSELKNNLFFLNDLKNCFHNDDHTLFDRILDPLYLKNTYNSSYFIDYYLLKLNTTFASQLTFSVISI